MQINTIFEKLSKSNNLRTLKQAQALITTLGHSHSQISTFKLIRAANSAAAAISHARQIFNLVPNPNIFLCAAIITLHVTNSLHHAAFHLFKLMLRRNSNTKPNQFIYPQILKSAAEILTPRAAASVQCHVIKSGFGTNPIVQTGLVRFYARNSGDVGSARKVFDEMSERSVVAWTALVCGYVEVGDVGIALELFEEMPERDVPSWNAVIGGCAQNGMFSEAVSLFLRFVRVFVAEGRGRPDNVTVACALSACGNTGLLVLGKWIHGYVFRNGLGFDPYVCNALVDMYGKCGNLKEARRVFNMATHKRINSWNSMINCYALHGQDKDAITVFEEMRACEDRDGEIRPNGITFIGLLNACTHGGLVEEGIAYFDLMRTKYAIEPEIKHYGCLIDLLGRAGRFDEALEVVKEMEFEPDEVVWASLLNGSKIHRRTDLSELALRKLIEIDPKNVGYVSALARLYGELGKWEETSEIRKVLRENKVYKTPGSSWIELFSNK